MARTFSGHVLFNISQNRQDLFIRKRSSKSGHFAGATDIQTLMAVRFPYTDTWYIKKENAESAFRRMKVRPFGGVGIKCPMHAPRHQATLSLGEFLRPAQIQ